MKKATSSLKLTPVQKAELAALAALPDDQINMRGMPEQSDWNGARRGVFFRPVKKQLTLRLDADLIDWFQTRTPNGKGYQTSINEALRYYIMQQGHKRLVATNLTESSTPVLTEALHRSDRGSDDNSRQRTDLVTQHATRTNDRSSSASTHHVLDQCPESLPGEDRSYRGNEFFVDTVPPGAWFRNLRSMMPLTQWNLISRYVRGRVKNSCEICGSDYLPEAHERWFFDEATKTQKLVRLMSLCKNCHLGTHWGLTGQLGLCEQIEEHVLSVTGWTKTLFRKHLAGRPSVAFSDGWTIDVSMITAAGLKISDPTYRISIKEKALDKEYQKKSIAIPGWGQIDLTSELRAGFVVFIRRFMEDTLNSLPVSECENYLAKDPKSLDSNFIQIPLAKYIAAYNNPVDIGKKQCLKTALQDLSVPKRLIIKGDWINQSAYNKYLKYGVIFSV